MKPIGPLSAYAAYKQNFAEAKNVVNGSASTKAKIKSKLNSKSKKRNSTGNKLNKTKVLLGIKHDNINIASKSSKVRPNKLKQSDTSKHNSSNVGSVVQRKLTKKRKKKKFIKEKSESTMKAHIFKNTEKKIKLVEMNALELKNKETQKIITIPPRLETIPGAQDPIMKGYKLFEWMISPINPENFFQEFWEGEPCHVSRNNKKYYTHLLTSRHLDQIFRENSLYYSKNVDVVIYENEEKQVLNPEGRATPSALWDFYSNGCSIRVLNPQTYNKKVHLLVSTLQEYFGSMVGVNVYLTPPGSQGFAPHYDDIEAFIIQLEGRKHWKLYRPKGEDVLARFSSKNFKHEEIGDPFLEVTLEQGSLLYFPRGVIHEGVTDSESHSLHITVSLYQNNAYIDLLDKVIPSALIKAARNDITFRQGLPLHFLRSNDAKEEIVKNVSKLFDSLKDYLDVDTGINELGRKLVYDSMPPVLSADEIACSSHQDGDVLDNGIVYNKVEFDLATKIRLTRFHCIQLVYDDVAKPRLYYSTENSNIYHGEEEQWLDLDLNLVPAVEALRKAYPFFIGIGFLPIEGVELKVQFVYDLWEKGIIITKEPLSSSFTAKTESLRDNIENTDSE